MKKIFKRTSLLLATALIGVTVQAQKSPQDMDRFIDALMRRMTVEEKIGQLNLPVTGEITTGQAKSSDVAKKIEQGLVGGLFNLKGVAKIRDVQKLAVENSRLGIPLLFGMDVIKKKKKGCTSLQSRSRSLYLQQSTFHIVQNRQCIYL